MLNVSQNSENLLKLGFALFFTSISKSPMIITLSYLLRYLFRILHRSPKKASMFQLLGGLYTLKIAHLLFLMLTSDNIISLFKLIVSSKGFQIRSFLTYSINHAPPPHQSPCRGGGCRGVTPPLLQRFLNFSVFW